MIIDGRKIAADIISELKALARPKKFLAAIIVGDDPASVSFLNQKEKAAKEIGVDFRIYRRPMSISSDDLRKEILKIANHKTCGGAIIQLPLPSNINSQYVLNAIPREKDVDVLGERALGAFYASRNPALPPAVTVVEKLLLVVGCKLSVSNVAIIGLGNLVGKPISLWLERKCKNLYLLRRGSDFSILKQADLVIAGTGSPHLIKADMLKDGATVIDFGYGRLDGKITGDFDPSSLVISRQLLVNYTPTPGGTGPVLVASLLRNFYILTNREVGI